MQLFPPIGRYYRQAKEFHTRYEKGLMPAMLVLGFLVDYITFVNVQMSITLALLSLYWVVAGLAIVFITFYDAGRVRERFRYARVTAFLVLQYSFGSLLSGTLVFYWFSGAFSVSWPIMAALALLMLFNDVFRNFFSRPQVQLGVYFFTTFSFFALMLPLLANSISAWLFVAAGVLSLVVFLAYVRIIFLIREFARPQKIHLLASIIIIAATMNILYFTDIIPPIPLAIREAGVYHSIKVSGASYVFRGEPETLWQKITPGQTLHVAVGERVYVYTAIFAPAKLDTTIVHQWEYYDEKQSAWTDINELSFDIFGGRSKGYKGYSYMSNLASGSWRVSVENQRGQVLGRVGFEVEVVEDPVNLQEVLR